MHKVSKLLYIILGIIVPFIGTSLGSFFVFFLKKDLNKKFQKLLVGFAAGVMIAASVWSLIIPSVEMAEKQHVISWIPAAIGFILGILFLLGINVIVDKLNNKKYKSLNMLMFSVTLHNIPEGMAVGVCFVSFLAGAIDFSAAFLLSIGIALQNIPEGAIISMPLKLEGKSKIKSFFYGVLSGIVEPIASFLTILLIKVVVLVLPYLLSFAAGAMIYVVVQELIPEMHDNDKSYLGVIGVAFGFVIMMILDIALS